MLREETPEENRERAAGDIEGGGADCLRPPGALRGQAHRGGGGAEEVYRHGEGLRRHHLHQELLRMLPSRGGDPAVAVQTVPAEDGASEGRCAGGQELEALRSKLTDRARLCPRPCCYQRKIKVCLSSTLYLLTFYNFH